MRTKQVTFVFSVVIAFFSFLPNSSRAQSDEAVAFFEKQLLVDGICFPYFRPGSTLHRFVRNPKGKFDMSEFRSATGVGIAVWDIRSPQQMAKMIRGVELGHFTNVSVIRNYTDVELVQRNKQHGWLFYTQVPWPLQGSIKPIEGWHRNGLRMMLVVYGSKMAPPVGDELGSGTYDSEDAGLTKLGKEVVAECNRVGIVLDVSHCNRPTTLDVARLSTSPITGTHAGCKAVTSHRRNKTDEEILAIAKTGGVFGISPIKFMLSKAKTGATMEDFIRHLEHAIKVAGVDHVGIASDMMRNGVPVDEVVAYTSPQLNSEKRWFHLYDALKEKGYSDTDLAKIFGQNYLRVFKSVLN